MVDFKKRLAAKHVGVVTDPVQLYETLDRASDKGPLRPAQVAVLNEWFSSRRGERDLVVKLHTGQGKTLIGMLILLSRLNEKKGPALYLCPDNYLIEQTRAQAKQFGIETCTADPDIPEEFGDGRKILVTSVQKLFNGLTKFGLHRWSVDVGTLLMDDAHACSDIIREQCRIRIPADDAAYVPLRTLFASELEAQGVGTYADICNAKYEAMLPVPYWAWIDHEADVAKVLSAGQNRKSIKFAWPLLKDRLAHCQCVVSGAAIEIEPIIPPLEAFGAYWNATNRIFMSATVTDDAFLVKGLQLSPATIAKPLAYERERWSGEKMVLIPSLIDESLSRGEIVHMFAPPNPNRTYGVVGLAPSFNGTRDWEKYGAKIATKDTIGSSVADLASGKFEKALVLVNRYDGIDLPDAACRVLVFDSKPYSESLIDLFQESCRQDSESTLMRTVRTVEQGFGRSVRGEKDYSVVVVTGTDLTRLVRDKNSRRFLSSQMALQIELGIEIATLAREEIESGTAAKDALLGLIKQCLARDAGWKAFYSEQMEAVEVRGPNEQLLRHYAIELAAEQKYQKGDYSDAVRDLQQMLDAGTVKGADRYWYLQEMARYAYKTQRSESRRLQVSAYNGNRYLLRPADGITVTKLVAVSHGRMERIIGWITQFDTYEQMDVALSDILSRLVFGGKADKFEQALDELSRALGFVGERPDREWKEGPDNLWALDDTQYILWECKNEVETDRSDINKHETEQMNRSCAWFRKHYAGMAAKNIMVIPTHNVASAASFIYDVQVMRTAELNKLLKAVRGFFKAFEAANLKDLSPLQVQQLVDSHKLSVTALLNDYTKAVKNRPRTATT